MGEGKMIFTLPELAYAFHDLEPFIDQRSLRIHYHKHHQCYIDRLNSDLQGLPHLKNASLEFLLSHPEQIPEKNRNPILHHGGAHFNHSLFWSILAPQGHSKPHGSVLHAIESTFGSFSEFQEQFTRLASEDFAGGWISLCVDKEGKLSILRLRDHEVPLTYGLNPILNLDLWEHAYYLKYYDQSLDYIASFWKIINWLEVNRKFTSLRNWVPMIA
jgi:superoxide dismutase, Fe-Mn family